MSKTARRLHPRVSKTTRHNTAVHHTGPELKSQCVMLFGSCDQLRQVCCNYLSQVSTRKKKHISNLRLPRLITIPGIKSHSRHVIAPLTPFTTRINNMFFFFNEIGFVVLVKIFIFMFNRANVEAQRFYTPRLGHFAGKLFNYKGDSQPILNNIWYL